MAIICYYMLGWWLHMFDRQHRKKYGWSDETDMSNDSDSKENTFIVYEKEGQFVKEYPNGKIVPLKIEGNA